MKNIIIAAMLIIMPFTMRAENSFDKVLETVIAANPEIKANAIGNMAEQESLLQENMLEGPEIEGYHKWGNKGDRKYGAGISQGFEWPGLYKARRRAAALNAAVADCRNRKVTLEKTVEAKSLLISLVGSQRKLNILARMDSSMRRLAATYNEGYRHGEISILDKNKIDIEVIKLAAMLQQQQNEHSAVVASLTNLTGGTDISGLVAQLNEYPDELLLPEEDYVTLLTERDPALAVYRLQNLVGDENLRIARMSGLPSFSVGYEWEREDGQNFNGVNLGIKFGGWSNKHSRNSARLSRLENETLLDGEMSRLMTDMRNDRQTALKLARCICDYGAILDYGKQESLLRQALDGGEINLLTYLQEVNYFLEAKIDYESAKQEYYTILSRLNRVNNI